MTFDWKNPNYDEIYKLRLEKLERLKKEPLLIKPLEQYYTENPVDFINDWGMTFDPRNAEIGLPTVIPFILFERQKEYINWVIQRWKNREDGLTEKSRDMGVSWLTVAIAVWLWRFHKGVVIGFGSRKEEYVDKIGDPKSLFWKIREFINFLPKELQPIGWDLTKHAPHMRVINPENGSAIVGEAGDNIGRGNRTSIYFKDESAFYEHADAIDAALSQTSNCKIDVSTPNGNGNAFYRKRHSGKIPVFTFSWTEDPRKDEKWYRAQKDKLDSLIVAQEIDMDYNASTSNAWIDGDSMQRAQRNGAADVEAIGQWVISIDAAHEGNDESVIHKRRGRLNLPQVVVKSVTGIQLAGIVEEEIRNLELSGGLIAQIVIELDGPGVSCYDQLRIGKYKDKVLGIHTGAKLKDNRNYNLRAKLWRKAKEYLADEPVSMPVCAELKTQLCSVKYQYKDGLLLMQSKKEYKKDFNKSPDRADAFILSFAANEQFLKPKLLSANRKTSWLGK